MNRSVAFWLEFDSYNPWNWINILPNLIDWFNHSNQINKMIIWHVLCEFKSVRVSVSEGTANKIIVEHALPLSLTKISKLQVEVQYRSTSAYTTFECRLLKCQRWSVIVCMLSPILEIFISFNSELTMKFIKLTARPDLILSAQRLSSNQNELRVKKPRRKHLAISICSSERFRLCGWLSLIIEN